MAISPGRMSAPTQIFQQLPDPVLILGSEFMSPIYLLLFMMMLIPCLIAMGFSSPRLPAIIWNYSWFLIFAKVGLLAFDSTWGAFPALVFAIQYAVRAMRPASNRPTVNMKFWAQSFGTQTEPPNRGNGRPVPNSDVIDAEFRRETVDTKPLLKSNDADQ